MTFAVLGPILGFGECRSGLSKKELEEECVARGSDGSFRETAVPHRTQRVGCCVCRGDMTKWEVRSTSTQSCCRLTRPGKERLKGRPCPEAHHLPAGHLVAQTGIGIWNRYGRKGSCRKCYVIFVASRLVFVFGEQANPAQRVAVSISSILQMSTFEKTRAFRPVRAWRCFAFFCK